MYIQAGHTGERTLPDKNTLVKGWVVVRREPAAGLLKRDKLVLRIGHEE